MDDAKELWGWWQSQLVQYGSQFTRPGWVRFVQWVTGTVLCGEEHTITQILVSAGLEDQWRNVEHLAEYGAWDRQGVERQTIRLLEKEFPARWGGRHPVAVDDTKLHRNRKDVWGTCTFHESSARSPNRAETVRAHNWVVAGDLVPGEPWTYLPHSARLYFRQSQLPADESFRKKTDLAGELLEQVDEESEVPILAVFDGAYAMRTVVRPCLDRTAKGKRRIDVLTRLRRDARLYHPTVPRNAMGRPRKWGRRLAAPRHHEKWNASWREGRAHIYGRTRRFRCKQMLCRWHVSGPSPPVHAYVFEVEGYRLPWYLVNSATDLSPEQVVELFPARFRQEDGFRDHKQRMGMEECRAWTKEPVLRTFQVQMVTMTLLRMMQKRLDERWGAGSWWLHPAWNRRKRHPSLLDLRRLFWRHREKFSQFLGELGEVAKVVGLPPRRRLSPAMVA